MHYPHQLSDAELQKKTPQRLKGILKKTKSIRKYIAMIELTDGYDTIMAWKDESEYLPDEIKAIQCLKVWDYYIKKLESFLKSKTNGGINT